MSSIEPCLLLPDLRIVKTAIFHEKCISLYEITAFQKLWFRHFDTLPSCSRTKVE